MSARTRSGTARASAGPGGSLPRANTARVTCRIPAQRLTTTQDGYDKCET